MAKENKFDLQPYLDKINEFDPNDIDWENMGSWPIAGKAVFCTIIALAILIGGYFMMLEPMQKKLSREISQEAQLKRDFENKAFPIAPKNPLLVWPRLLVVSATGFRIWLRKRKRPVQRLQK